LGGAGMTAVPVEMGAASGVGPATAVVGVVAVVVVGAGLVGAGM
jgi:hypothetical protein